MIHDFKTFIMRGNLIDLAAAVIIGTAFGAVVNSLVKDVLTPLIAAVGGQPNFDTLALSVGSGVVKYGVFVNTLTSFLIVAAVLFVILKAVERLSARRAREEQDQPPSAADELLLLGEIRDLLAGQRV